MKHKNLWVDLSIINLCVVALLGFILRSKILFALPWINYLYLLDAHSHFAFEGWVTLALLLLLVQELLPETCSKRSIYQWMFGGIVLSSWGILLSSLFNGNGFLHTFFSAFFISVSYVFGWIFIRNIRKAGVSKTVHLLSVSAVISLILSSAGPITLVYLQTIKSLHAILYRDALYVYLHLQYNGFFTLAVFDKERFIID